MQVEKDLIAKLTSEGAEFETTWTSFMFNMVQAQKLKKAKTEDILNVLRAGLRFKGTGWTTGKASKALWQISGCAMVKSAIDPYRDVWLFAIALMADVDLPILELSQD